MLIGLSIRNIVLISALDLEFDSGLSVLTGETGAGKSILLDSLALALGGRGDAGLVRQGCTQGQVIATFSLAADHPVRKMLTSHDLSDDGEILLKRIQFADGRTKAFVNDLPVSAQLLQSLGVRLVEIHGQHADRALMEPERHRNLLDAFGGLETEVDQVVQIFDQLSLVRQELGRQMQALEEALREADYLRHARAELAKLAPQAGEETDLAEKRTLMQQAEKISSDLQESYEALAGSSSVVPALSAAMRRLQRREAQVPHLIEPVMSSIDRAMAALDEAAIHLQDALNQVSFAPHELEQLEERLFALRAASRKYQVPVDDLASRGEQFEQQLAALDQGEHSVELLRQQQDQLERQYRELAQALSLRRHEMAQTLQARVNTELPPLRLEKAEFTVRVDTHPDTVSREGLDQVEFWVQTNPGSRPGPMMKVASGGELARFMLALKVVLADRGSAPTLIFDEIDTGAGGAVADAIGARLKRLSGQCQVLTITHAPQVAARADQHYFISKSHTGADKTQTQVTRLDAAARQEEVARMLAGASITKEALAAAERLMREAAA